MRNRRIHARVFFSHLQPPLIAVDQPLQPLAVHLHRLLDGPQTTTVFTETHKQFIEVHLSRAETLLTDESGSRLVVLQTLQLYGDTGVPSRTFQLEVGFPTLKVGATPPTPVMKLQIQDSAEGF